MTEDDSAALTSVLNSIDATFQPPFGESEAQKTKAMQTYSRALTGFKGDVLSAAWNEVVRTWTKPGRPPAGMIVEECMKIIGRARLPKDSFTQRRLAWEKARCERLAFTAAQEGVAWSFKAAIYYDGKRPEEISIPRLKRMQMEARSTRDRIEGNEPHFWNDRNIGVIEGEAKITALVMWNKLEENERHTADEIRRHQTA